MNYFEYQPKEQMGRIWSLFVQLSEMSEEEMLKRDRRQCSYAHTLEIVKAAMSGSISTVDDSDIDDFNLLAYEIRCAQNDKNEQRKDVDKCLFIVDDVDIEDSEARRVGYGDVSSKKLSSTEEAFKKLDNIESFEQNLLQLLNIRSEYIVSHGVDVVGILKNSLKGISDASNTLKQLVDGNRLLKDLVLSLCEDAEEGILMERLSQVV